MPKSDKDEMFLTRADDAEILILPSCRPEEIRTYAFDRQFGTHAQYRSIYTKRDTLEENALVQGANVTLALNAETIVGFGVLNHPDPEDRWTRLGDGIMMEVKVIEVARRYRSAGIAHKIMEGLLSNRTIEGMIVYMVGYSWTWDLDGTGMSAQQYRNMMIRLFAAFGFREFQTNEPNICLKPENLFMARIGENVPQEVRTRFKWLLFGVEMKNE